jgi:hypothetical protein
MDSAEETGFVLEEELERVSEALVKIQTYGSSLGRPIPFSRQ